MAGGDRRDQPEVRLHELPLGALAVGGELGIAASRLHPLEQRDLLVLREGLEASDVGQVELDDGALVADTRPRADDGLRRTFADEPCADPRDRLGLRRCPGRDGVDVLDGRLGIEVEPAAVALAEDRRDQDREAVVATREDRRDDEAAEQHGDVLLDRGPIGGGQQRRRGVDVEDPEEVV
jgi:hypothetical protein